MCLKKTASSVSQPESNTFVFFFWLGSFRSCFRNVTTMLYFSRQSSQWQTTDLNWAIRKTAHVELGTDSVPREVFLTAWLPFHSLTYFIFFLTRMRACNRFIQLLISAWIFCLLSVKCRLFGSRGFVPFTLQLTAWKRVRHVCCCSVSFWYLALLVITNVYIIFFTKT